MIKLPGAVLASERPVWPCIYEVGYTIGLLHNSDIAHGDLTIPPTCWPGNKLQVVLIDYGLSTTSSLTEDKAVDVYVLEKAFLSHR